MTMDLRMKWLQWLKDEPRRLTRLLLMGLVTLYAGWIGYQFVRNKLYDFNLHYIAAAGFRQGLNMYVAPRDPATSEAQLWAEVAGQHSIEHYDGPPYLYPPFTAQVVLPLTLLPPRVAGTIWLMLTGAAFVLSAWLLGRSSSLRYGAPLAYVLLLAFVPPLATLHAGQVNGFVLLSLSLAVYGLSRRDWIRAGVGVALAALFKLIPLALLLYLVWRQRWKATIIAVVVLLVVLLTAPLTLGPGTLHSYGRRFPPLGRLGIIFDMPPNQSLNGFYGRLLAGLATAESIYRIYLASAVLLVLGTVACCWPLAPLGSSWRLEFALIICALQLMAPFAWYHQLVLLLIPLFTLVTEVVVRRAPRWWLASLTLGFLVTDLHGLAWHQLAACPGWLMSRLLLSMPFYTTVMLWGMLAWLIIQGKRSGAAQGSAA